jgi:dTDP-4-dehydrorhamnose reductase
MKVLVTGVKGQLGYDVMNELAKRGYEGVGVDVAEMDITDSAAVEKVISEVHPDKVVHCAAWTAVDAAEDNQEVCHKVNVDGTANIAKMCGKLDIPMVYISTDYVFDGQGIRPWEPDDPVVEPLNVYGQSKYEGEVAVEKYAPKHYIVRIAWVFGLNGKNFIKTMINLGKTHDTLTVVNDQIGTPTYTYDLARLLVDMLEKEEYGKYHATNEGGYISWYDFAKEIFAQAVKLGEKEYADVKVIPVTTAEYGISKAARPFNSRLDRKRICEEGFQPLPVWKNALEKYLQEVLAERKG